MARQSRESGSNRPKRDRAKDAEFEEAFPAEWATLEEAMPGDPFFAMGAAELAEAQAEREARKEARKAEDRPETDDGREMRGEPPAPAPLRDADPKAPAGEAGAEGEGASVDDAEALAEQTREERSGVIQGAVVTVAVIAACVVAILILLFMGMAPSV